MTIFSTKHARLRNCFLYGFISSIGSVLFYFHMDLVDALYNRLFVISPSSLIIENWYSITGDELSVELYLFNWTNPEDFLNKSVKPTFTELGPYFLHEHMHRKNVQFNENYTVTYQNKKTFYFDREKSVGTFDDEITNLNAVPIIAVDKGKHWGFFMRKALAIALNPLTYEKKATIREWVFEGYEDPLLNARKVLPFLDEFPDMDEFAWFYKRNGSVDYEGVSEIGSGLGNTTVGTIYSWNYQPTGPYSGNCSHIRSSNGEIYKQKLTKDRLEFFLSDFCRTVAFDYRETVDFYGMNSYKYVGNTSFFDEGNPCLCPKRCLKSGVLDYSNCKFKAPIYLSYPHFMNADPSFRDSVEGMKPDPKKHESYIIANDRTGIPFDGSIAIQINLLVEPTSLISKYKDVPEILFPILWFRVNVNIPNLWLMKLWVVLKLPFILKMASFMTITAGLILFSLSLRKYLIDINETRKPNFHDENFIFEEIKPLDSKKHFLQ